MTTLASVNPTPPPIIQVFKQDAQGEDTLWLSSPMVPWSGTPGCTALDSSVSEHRALLTISVKFENKPPTGNLTPISIPLHFGTHLKSKTATET